MIIEEKTKKKAKLSEYTANTTARAEVIQASSSVDLAGKNIWAISNADHNAAKKL